MSASVGGARVDFAMRVALCTLPSGTRLEIIQPLDDLSPYASSLAQHGGADHIHHVRFDVDDYGAARGRLLELGLETVLDASFEGAPGVESTVTATYFGTEAELGLLLEVGDVPKGFAMPEPERLYPEEEAR